MNLNNKKSRILAGICTAMVSVVLLGSCIEEQHPGRYYTFTGQTVADFLEQDPQGRFSEFINVLKKAQTWGELDTYGEFTCFAPTNSAFEAHYRQLSEKTGKTIESYEDISKADCDTIAWTHLIKSVYFMSDMVEGALPSVNLLDRFLSLSYDSAANEQGHYRLRNCINKRSHIIEVDDTVENGVVQVVDSVIKVAGEYVFDILKEDTLASIFFQALNLVSLEDSLKKWKDLSYFISYDSVYEGVTGQGGGSDYQVYYWGERKTNFTILVENNKVMRENGIYNLEDLIEHANKVYHESYPNDGTKYDTLWSDRRNPLNRFISYHILPFAVPSDANFNCRSDIVSNRWLTNLLDPEDYFETYMPHSIMRVSTVISGAEKGVYINRRGIGSSHDGEIGRPYHRGVRIYTSNEMLNVNSEGCNGYYHYIDGMLDYSKKVREDILNRRMRIDCCTLSPDFMTSGARQASNASNYVGKGFKQPERFHSFNEDYMMWVRVASTGNVSFQGDGLDLMGNYDIMLKLPPVPYDGTWELRLSYRGYEGCGVVQNYVGDDPKNLLPCGIPTDLRLSAEGNHNIGWVADDSDELGDDEEKIRAHDKAMHNRGYMKGPDSHTTGGSNGTPFRDYSTMARRIITTDYFYAGRDYYLRMKLVLDNPKAEMNFDYMEWCPKSIYDFNEDKH